MKKRTLKEKISPNFSDPYNIALRSQDTLRITVGTLGICLPIFLYLFLQITNNFNPILPSISHYYFTRSNCFFLIIVSLMAIFLMIYKGYKLEDYLISNLAGLAALLMLIFPTGNLYGIMNGKFNSVAVTFFDSSDFRPQFHYICAAIFLLSLAYMSFFLFTKSDITKLNRSKRKRIRNRIYRGCAVIMVLAMLVAFLGFKEIINPSYYDSHNLTFWMETISVEAFGFSWMVKGEIFFPDKKKEMQINLSDNNSNYPSNLLD